MVKTWGTSLECTCHHHHTVVGRRRPVKICKIAGQLGSQVKIVNVFCLTEIERIVKLRKHYQLCAFCGQIGYGGNVSCPVGLHI